MIRSLTQSQNYNSCIANADIHIHAQTTLLNKLTFYYDLLDEKYTLLTTKQDVILSHIQVIDPVLLQELSDITQGLDKYNF
jgi:hypothetical protein